MTDRIIEFAIQAMVESCAHFGEDIPTQAEHDELYSDEESKWFFKRFAELVRNEAQQPAPVQEPVPQAVQTVIAAMQADPGYAWSWHCNIAMAYVDAGGDPHTGNQGAARFMKMLANVDPAHELPQQPAVEPVAWYDGRKFYATPSAAHMDCADIKALRPLYEAPQAPQPAPVQEPVNIDQIASERYKVVPTHESMFYRWAVVAGDGSQQLYIGREVDCQNMARKFAGAFLDGAYLAASQSAPVQEPARRRIAIEECLFVLRPSVKGKFPQEQALEELAGFTAQPRKVMKLSEAEMRSLAKQCDEGGEDNEYLLALSNAIEYKRLLQDALRYRWLVAYFVSDRTDQDEAIVAASAIGVDQVTAVIDAAMEAE